MATLEEIKRKIQEMKEQTQRKEREEVKWWKLPKKAHEKVKFRLVPYTDRGDILFNRSYHFVPAKDEEGNIRFYRSTCFLQDCPVCEALRLVREEFYSKDREGFIAFINQFGRFQRQDKVVMNVHNEDTAEVLLLEQSLTFTEWLVENYEMGNNVEISGDRAVVMWRKSDTGAWERTTVPAKVLDEKYISEVKSKAVNLDEYFKNIYSEEEKQRAIEIVDIIHRKVKQLQDEGYFTSTTSLSVSSEAKSIDEDIPKSEPEAISNSDTSEEVNIPEELKDCFGKKFLEIDKCITCDYSIQCMNEFNKVKH